MTQPNFIAAYLCDKKSFDQPRYLLLKRSQEVYLPGIWQMVTGKIDLNETAATCVLREIFEETGYQPKAVYNVDVTLFYDQSKHKIAYSANFCALIDAQVLPKISSKEHETFGFFTLEEALQLIAFPSQKQTLQFIHEHFILQIPHEANLLR